MTPAGPVVTPAETAVPPETSSGITNMTKLRYALHHLKSIEKEDGDDENPIRDEVFNILSGAKIPFEESLKILDGEKIAPTHVDAIKNHLASLSAGSTPRPVENPEGTGDGVGAGDTSTSSDAADAAKRDADAADEATREAAEKATREAADEAARVAAEKATREAADEAAREAAREAEAEAASGDGAGAEPTRASRMMDAATRRASFDPLATNFAWDRDPLPDYKVIASDPLWRAGARETHSEYLKDKLKEIETEYDKSGLTADAKKIAALKTKKLIGWEKSEDEDGVKILNPEIVTLLHKNEFRRLGSIVEADKMLTAIQRFGSGSVAGPRFGDVALAKMDGWDTEKLNNHDPETLSKLPDYQIRDRLFHLYRATSIAQGPTSSSLASFQPFAAVHADQVEGIKALLEEAKRRKTDGAAFGDDLSTTHVSRAIFGSDDSLFKTVQKNLDAFIAYPSRLTAHLTAEKNGYLRDLPVKPLNMRHHPETGKFYDYQIEPNTIPRARGGSRVGAGRPSTATSGSLGLKPSLFARYFAIPPALSAHLADTSTSFENGRSQILGRANFQFNPLSTDRADSNPETLQNVRTLYIIASKMHLAAKIPLSKIKEYIDFDEKTGEIKFTNALMAKGGKTLNAAISGALIGNRIKTDKSFAGTGERLSSIGLDAIPILGIYGDIDPSQHIAAVSKDAGDLPHKLALTLNTRGAAAPRSPLASALLGIRKFFPSEYKDVSDIASAASTSIHPGHAESPLRDAGSIRNHPGIAQYQITDDRYNFFTNGLGPSHKRVVIHSSIKTHFLQLLDQIPTDALLQMKDRINSISPHKAAGERGSLSSPVISKTILTTVKQDILDGNYAKAFQFFNTLQDKAGSLGLKEIQENITMYLKTQRWPQRELCIKIHLNLN